VWGPGARWRFRRNRGATVGTVLVLLLVVFAVLGPVASSHGPLTSEFIRAADAHDNPVGPSADFLLGADRLFRAELVRLAYGARLSLTIAVMATLIASLLGAAVGIVAGYNEGKEGARVPWVSLGALAVALWLWTGGHGLAALSAVFGAAVVASVAHRAPGLRAGPRINLDTGLMRVVDVGLAFPFLLLVMAIGAALERTTALTIMLTLGLTGWLGTARIIRAKTLTIRNLDFVVASRALGQSTWRVLWHHVVPNMTGPLIVIATISVAQMIVAESVLSYLGAGISPPTPTWGQMLFEGQDSYLVAPWLLIAPGVMILMAVFGFNLLGEGLRDALDPQED
jgi:ABC-type dipeptide/oligopeptide/nickel transport system permease subunit